MKRWVSLICLLIGASVARADVVDEAWRRGNESYFKGDYRAAVAAYDQLDRQGVVSPDLYYNLGAAHFRAGSLGSAIWSFERARALEPDADDARFGLEQLRKQAQRRVHDKIEGAEHEAAWIHLVTALPTSWQTWLFSTLYLACFVVLFLRRRADPDARATFTAAAAILGVGALLGGALLVGRATLDRIPFAIVLPDKVQVKEGADANHRTSFELHAGLKLRLLETDRDWVRIQLPNGLEGWLPLKEVGRL